MTRRKRIIALAGIVFLAIVASFFAAGPAWRWWMREEAFNWCRTYLPRRNYHAYELANEYASRFSHAQRQELIAWLKQDLQQNEEDYGLVLRPEPPERLWEKSPWDLWFGFWSPRCTKCAFGLAPRRYWYSKALLDRLQSLENADEQRP